MIMMVYSQNQSPQTFQPAVYTLFLLMYNSFCYSLCKKMKGTKKGRDVNEFIGLDMKILGRVCDKLE